MRYVARIIHEFSSRKVPRRAGLTCRELEVTCRIEVLPSA